MVQLNAEKLCIYAETSSSSRRRRLHRRLILGAAGAAAAASTAAPAASASSLMEAASLKEADARLAAEPFSPTAVVAAAVAPFWAAVASPASRLATLSATVPVRRALPSSIGPRSYSARLAPAGEADQGGVRMPRCTAISHPAKGRKPKQQRRCSQSLLPSHMAAPTSRCSSLPPCTPLPSRTAQLLQVNLLPRSEHGVGEVVERQAARHVERKPANHEWQHPVGNGAWARWRSEWWSARHVAAPL